jgi:hypothetical protein
MLITKHFLLRAYLQVLSSALQHEEFETYLKFKGIVSHLCSYNII